MKKLILFLTTVCLLWGVMTFAAAADTPAVTISASKDTLNRGDTVTITVKISQVDSCTSVGVGLSFDSSVFEYVDGSYKLLLSGTSADSFKYVSNSGGYVASIMLDSASTVSGNLFQFSLKVKETAPLGASTVGGTPSLRVNKAAAECTLTSCKLTVACAHSYDNACDESCNSCGATRTITHAWDSGKVTTEATCTGEGVKTYTCTVCGAVSVESVGAKAHSYDKGVVTTEATCTSEGVKTFTCTSCGKTYTEAISKKDHSYDKGVVTTEATCTGEGVKTFTCSGCGKTYTEAIAKKDHSYDKGVVTTEATCTGEGVKTFTCSGCGKTYTEAIAKKDHSYDKGVVTTEATCTGEGVKTFTCSGCGKTYTEAIAKKDHSYDKGVVTTEATCTGKGVRTFTCSGCGKTYTESIAATGHSYDGNCDAECNTCGKARTVEHDYNSYWSFDAEGHWHECSNCGDRLETVEHIPGGEATEETDQICTVCGYVIVAAHSHEHSPYGDRLSDENGHWYQCACGEIMESEAHIWDEGHPDEALGLITYYCIECGHPVTDELPPVVTEPSEPDETQGGDGTQPQETTEPTGGNQNPGNNQSGGDDTEDEFPWVLVAVIAGAALLGVLIFVIAGILVSKKQTGKYTS